jgi:hypothetical protein
MCRGVFLRISRCLPFLRRLLLISSGEVLKFDFPEALDEPNCIPTAEAMHWALPTGDHVAPNPCAPTPLHHRTRPRSPTGEERCEIHI